MRATAKCRYIASQRVKLYGTFSFHTTIFLSLGLILIPLIQSTKIPLCLKDEALSMMQIFLAVAVLVYSTIIGTEKYELRSEALNTCGDELKKLIRSIGELCQEETQNNNKLEEFRKEYSSITAKTENHLKCDYKLSMLEMKNDYIYTGIPRLSLAVSAYIRAYSPLILPMIFIVSETVFITDMIGITECLPKIFHLSAPS